MNHYVVELTGQIDLEAIAHDIATLLSMPSNLDISEEFPSSFARYSGDHRTVRNNLAETVSNCNPGIRQQFVAFCGPKAVGMSVIRFADEVPEGVQETWPNVSGFICHPFRGRGLGALSLKTRLDVVKEQFSGNAWTQVKRSNTASNKMVICAGFVQVSETSDHTIYAYHA